MKIPSVKLLSTTIKLRHNLYYPAAHKGDLNSAFSLIDMLVTDYSRFKTYNGFVCPVQKYSGNKIPLALAIRITQNCTAILCDTIYLTNNRPGNTMIQRMTYEPIFTGLVPSGKYLLVDDVITTGITLKALKNYIENSGNQVNAVKTLGSSSSGGLFEPSKLQLSILLSGFPDINRYFDSASLTIPQIYYLEKFSSLSSYLSLYSNLHYNCQYS